MKVMPNELSAMTPGERKIYQIMKNMGVQCPNCKKAMTKEEYYGGHLNNEECLKGQEEIERKWQERQDRVAKNWVRKN